MDKDYRKTIKEKQIHVRDEVERIEEKYDIRYTNYYRDEENDDYQ